mmetsp:Transcript_13552/g.23354  ORF Transcript_13552/g.23354 Transcript_13552/m.23354 type:complete len:149 (-) Transcript_13552:1575-2021(-)
MEKSNLGTQAQSTSLKRLRQEQESEPHATVKPENTTCEKPLETKLILDTSPPSSSSRSNDIGSGSYHYEDQDSQYKRDETRPLEAPVPVVDQLLNASREPHLKSRIDSLYKLGDFMYESSALSTGTMSVRKTETLQSARPDPVPKTHG